MPVTIEIELEHPENYPRLAFNLIEYDYDCVNGTETVYQGNYRTEYSRVGGVSRFKIITKGFHTSDGYVLFGDIDAPPVLPKELKLRLDYEEQEHGKWSNLAENIKLKLFTIETNVSKVNYESLNAIDILIPNYDKDGELII